MAKKSSKPKSKSKSPKSRKPRKSTSGGSGYMKDLKLVGSLALLATGITMADRAREGLSLNPFSADYWT